MIVSKMGEPVELDVDTQENETGVQVTEEDKKFQRLRMIRVEHCNSLCWSRRSEILV